MCIPLHALSRKRIHCPSICFSLTLSLLTASDLFNLIVSFTKSVPIQLLLPLNSLIATE